MRKSNKVVWFFHHDFLFWNNRLNIFSLILGIYFLENWMELFLLESLFSKSPFNDFSIKVIL